MSNFEGTSFLVPAIRDCHDNHDIKEAERDNEEFVAEAINGDPRHQKLQL